MKYVVMVTDEASKTILAQTRYIAIDRESPLNAERWFEQIWDTIDGLKEMPKRHGLALESAYEPEEVRKVAVGNYLILFMVDEHAGIVRVTGFRHASRRAQPPDQSI